MPSSIAHGAVAILLAPMLRGRTIERDVIVSTAVAAMLPDIDALGRPFGMGDLEFLGGHRAVTHSVWAALLIGAIVVFRTRPRPGHPDRWLLGAYVSLVFVLHGVLDALASYGEGVAFMAPVSMTRWKGPWLVFTGVMPEILLVWMPALVVYVWWLRPQLVASRSQRPAA